MFQSILCPVDFSRNARAALRLAATLARASRATLTVLFVNDPMLAAAAAAVYDRRLLAAAGDRDLRRFVARALGKDSLTPNVRLVSAIGKPAAEIVKAAKAGKCDLIVMGTQGVTARSRWLFGSVTEGVLKSAQVPVLAVPLRRAG